MSKNDDQDRSSERTIGVECDAIGDGPDDGDETHGKGDGANTIVCELTLRSST